MLDKRLGFWLILGLAFFTFACEDPGEIGLEINPENGVFVAKYHEIPFTTSILQHEDVVSDNSTRIDGSTQTSVSDGRLITGGYTSQDFGKIQSKAFSSLYLGSIGFNPSDDFIFDSLVFFVRLDYLYGENFNGNKKIFVHELAEEIKLDSLYLTKNSTSYLEEPLGEFNIDISLFDSTNIDTVLTARLSDELGMRFLDKAKTDTLTYNNNIDFRKFFNGIALISDESNEVVVGVHAESRSTFMRLYIHDATDTTHFNYILYGWDPEGKNITRYYNNITLDKSGTPIEGIPGYYTEFQTGNGKSYIQGSTGIFSKLNFGPYFNFLDTIDHLVINRAELVIPVEEYTNYLEPTGSLDLYFTDQDNRFTEFYDSVGLRTFYATVSRLSFVKDDSENKGEYIGDVTDFIQDLSSGIRTDSLFLIGQSSLWNSVISVNQSIISKDKVSLNIYYSTIQ